MGTPSSVAIHTLGCKLNFAESSSITQKFRDHGFHVHAFHDEADVYVINTCSVTEFADRKCRSAVRKALRQNPDARIVVVGCYAQLKPQEIADIDGVDLVLGAAEKFDVVNYVEALGGQKSKGLVHNTDIQTVNSFEEAFSYGDRTRSFLKIQDGCDYNCSFCTIPLARGSSRSGRIDDILARIRHLEENGIREVVLTGVNIGDYGKGIDEEIDFLGLIQRIEAESSIPRFRISSIEPNLCSTEIIRFVASSARFMPHFHMPLQSGSDRILAKMRRRYRCQLYRDRVSLIKEILPSANIGVDVIVGFPGETEQDFLETVHFLEDLDISYLHVFTYSQRENTPAAAMESQVPIEIRRHRNRILRDLSAKKRRHFTGQHLGQSHAVLFEPAKSPGMHHGFTENYIKVSIATEEDLTNQLVDVVLEDLDADGQAKGKLKKTRLPTMRAAQGDFRHHR